MATSVIPTLNTIVAEPCNFLFMAADTTTFSMTFKNDDGTPKIITGIAFKMQIKKKATDLIALGEFTIGSGLSIGAEPPSLENPTPPADIDTLFFAAEILLKGEDLCVRYPRNNRWCGDYLGLWQCNFAAGCNRQRC